MEEWRTVHGFPKYEVSNKGRIRNLNSGRFIKPSIDKRGYEYVCLRKDGISHTRRLHRMVAETFMSDDCKELDVTHRDGNRSNNNLGNLYLKTRSQNMLGIYRNGYRQIHRMKKIVCVETGEIFNSISECAAAMNTSSQAVSRCVNNPALANRDGYHFRAI